MQLQENTIFDSHYTLIRQLGRGGFSEVWLAHDSYMDLDVALKIYAPGQGMDANSIQAFRHEIKGVFNLNQPNLLTPKTLGVYDNMPYLVLPYCKRGSIYKNIGKMQEPEIWQLIHDVASGLAYLHKNNIIHQDIKPDNILLDDNGNYIITDFGVSIKAVTILSNNPTSMGTVQNGGTMAYMGPERFSKQPAPVKASDIWSFGAMVHELITGQVPFGAMGGGLQRGGAEMPEINEPISDKLLHTIERMLASETWDRPTAEELAESARKYLHKSRNQQPYGDDSLTGEESNTNGGGRPTVGFPTEPPAGGDQTSGGENKWWKYVIGPIICIILIATGIYVYYLCTRPTYYRVQFINYDNTILADIMVREGAMPHYNGTPFRPGYGQESYKFTGWSPTIVPTYKSTRYRAKYIVQRQSASPTKEDITVKGNGKTTKTNAPRTSPKTLNGFLDIRFDKRTAVEGIPGGYVEKGDRIRGRFENGKLVHGKWYKHDGSEEPIMEGSKE